MKSLRLLLAAALCLLSAFAAADPYLLCEFNPGASPTEVASQYSITLKDYTSDNLFAMYDATSQSHADSVVAAMATNTKIKTVTLKSNLTALPSNKGSTLPAVGGRSELQVANESLLSLMNWDGALATGSGREVRVAILDTGLASSQSALWSKVVAMENFVEEGLLPIDRALGTDSDGDGVADEGTGHGTMVASIIDFVAPKVNLVVARVSDSDGYADEWRIVKAIEFAMANDVEVINLSFAGQEPTPIIRSAIRNAEDNGVLVIAGLGNSSIEKAFYPAKYDEVVSVTALTAEGTKSSFSNWNSVALVAAPGLSVIGQSNTGSLAQWSGTSCATAFVSAVVADCLRRRGHVPPTQMRWMLSTYGANVDTLNPNYKSKLGSLVDHKALNSALGN